MAAIAEATDVALQTVSHLNLIENHVGCELTFGDFLKTLHWQSWLHHSQLCSGVNMQACIASVSFNEHRFGSSYVGALSATLVAKSAIGVRLSDVGLVTHFDDHG